MFMYKNRFKMGQGWKSKRDKCLIQTTCVFHDGSSSSFGLGPDRGIRIGDNKGRRPHGPSSLLHFQTDRKKGRRGRGKKVGRKRDEEKKEDQRICLISF